MNIPLIRNMHDGHTFSFLKVIFLIRTWTKQNAKQKIVGEVISILLFTMAP